MNERRLYGLTKIQSVTDTPPERVAHSPRQAFMEQCPTPSSPGRNDIGHARIPAVAVARVFAVMALSPQHSFQILTKRPARLRRMLTRPGFTAEVHAQARALLTTHPAVARRTAPRVAAAAVCWPLPNVWIGVSIETDDYCWRADELRRIPAAVRFLSCEPLLGPLPALDLTGIDWVIVGGESGPGFWPLDLDWVRDIRDRCTGRQIPLFFKQVGGLTSKAGGRQLDGRAWGQYPVPNAKRCGQ